MRLLYRAISIVLLSASAALFFAGCQLFQRDHPAAPLNTHAIAVVVEQQDLAVRSAQAFRRTHPDGERAVSREAEARYRGAAAAYARFARAAAEAVASPTPADAALEQRAAEAALRGKEFNTFALQNTDSAHRSLGTGTVALVTAEQLARFGRDAWQSSGGRSRRERAAFAEGMRTAAQWPEWSSLK